MLRRCNRILQKSRVAALSQLCRTQTELISSRVTPAIGTASLSGTRNDWKRFENNIFYHSSYNFSSVWGERTISWIKESIHKHMETHKEDYSFDTHDIPFLQSKEIRNEKRLAIVTPCIKQATSSYLIDVLLDSGYHVTGVADPTANLKVIQNRFKIKDAKVNESKEDGYTINVIDSASNPALYVEQRPLNTFTVFDNEWQTFDVVFDEMPLLDLPSDKQLAGKTQSCKTTVFGHALKKGGLIYLQTEGAKKYSEKVALVNKIQGFYPETHFAMIDSRKTPFTRQFLFMKVENTLK